MRTFLLVFISVIVFSCGGSLTDEQRKKMKEAREQQAIMKVTDAEITEAAFEKGRAVMEQLTEPDQADSVGQIAKVKIHWLEPGGGDALEIEQQLIDAYINSVIEGGKFEDNVQNFGMDSVLYTKPVVLTRPDGSIEVKGTWNIWMTKKQLILGMKKK
ncbi:MAG TPA: hypothetical protein VFU05_18335 [Cyclobacteriaceae bacterium]|nr:hypothetical protein [Cyclobacteriaceae bacterium]